MMRGVVGFLRTTIIGGVLLLVPFVVLVVVINKALDFAARLIRPLADRIPESLGLGATKAYVAATLLLVLFSLLAGLLARSAMARKFVQTIEVSLLSLVPGYDYLKQAGASLLRAEDPNAQLVVLIRFGDSWRIGVKTETIGENWLAVFVPNSPNPTSGGLFIVERSKVRPISTPLVSALASLQRCGAGASWVAEALEGGGAGEGD